MRHTFKLVLILAALLAACPMEPAYAADRSTTGIGPSAITDAVAGQGLRRNPSTGALEINGGECVITDSTVMSGVDSGTFCSINNSSGTVGFTLPSVDHTTQSGLTYLFGAAGSTYEITMNRGDSDLISYDTAAPASSYTFFANGHASARIRVTLVNGANLGLGSVGVWAVEQISTQKLDPTTRGSWYTTYTDDGNCATTKTVDWSVSQTHKVTLTGDCTFTFTDPGFLARLELVLCQDGTGSHVVTAWDGDVSWPSATAPTITATASKCDKYFFESLDGTSYTGSTSGQNY